MAFRLHDQFLRGEIDNRTKGKVTGTLWFVNRPEPVLLELEGNCWRDLAGRLIRITNTKPLPGNLEGLSSRQHGRVGDMTASRKVRVPEVSIEEMMRSKGNYPWHWGNCVYLEWFSLFNGRVVLESVDYRVEVVGWPAWEMTGAEEQSQLVKNQESMVSFMDLAAEALEKGAVEIDDLIEQDAATSSVEADADAHDAKMNKFHDRVEARLHALGDSATPEDHERIMDEEMERLRLETEGPREPLTPEQEAERDAWIEEMNRICQEALDDPNPLPEPRRHPLQVRCSDLGMAIHHAIKDHQWLDESDSAEHPLRDIEFGVDIAAAKLAGALNSWGDEERWPPDPLLAGDKLVRLKKARRHLRDALAGMDAAEEQRLADADWRIRTRYEISTILKSVEQLIVEVRAICEKAEESGEEE